MTKYKPLYALYKGLKEHGTDLPDSYGSFERSMTQAGNAGASNRRNFYQSLKDSNYDVPDTYEKFYESMFVPVNNTTSRARKIGETPITDEDRKGFTLGAQDIRMNASKFAAGDALRYNKLKQRKQKQRKDFGRVKVGTNKTPYAPTDNVVKDEGLNTYVTSDSSDTTNLDYAQQKQAVLDEQNQAYMNAIERGDIPMASETIDKNGLYDLQENIGKDGTEVTEKGIKEQAEARLNVAYQKQKDIMAQLSAAMDGGFSTFEERMQLSATKNKIDEEVRNLEALAGKESSGSWNTLADVANTIPLLHNIKEGINYLFGDDTSKDMYKAIANSMVQSNWDFGVSDIQNSVKLEQIRDKINKGEAVTKEEKEFLDANQKADKSAEWVDQYGSRAYRWTFGAGVSVPYMIDFYITGGLPLMRGMTQAFGRGAMKIAAKRGWGKLAHNIMYYTGVAAGDIIGSYAMATTVQGLKTGSDVLNRHLGTLYQDEKGNYAFGTFDENGNLLHEGGESFGKALYKGVTAAMLENYTEKMFGHWHLKSGAFDLLDKNPYTKKLADFFRGVGNKNWYLDTKKFSSKFGIGSYPEEVAEEIVNIPLNAWLVGDNSIKELGDRKTWEDIAGSMAISVGSMAGMASTPHIVRGAANQGIKAYDFAAFYVFKNRLNQANQRASEILGDEWEVIKNRIDSAPNENLGKISADLHKQVSEGKYSEEQLDAAWAYIQNLRVMRGYNLAKTMEMQAKAMTGDENTPADIRQKQLNAAYAAGQETEGENKHLAQVEYEKQKFNLASALGVSDSELENMTDEQISSNLGLDDNLDNVIYNYQNAKALYDGIMDNAQNAVDTATKVAAQRVDAMTNVEDGTIKQALVNGTMGKDDYPVYVISGNIETHDDGIINYSDSDSMVIVYNVATGRKETIPVSMLSAVNPYIQNAEEFKAQAVNEAKEKTITELSNVIDGKLVDGSQFTMEDAQGQIHDYIIEGIDEQGNCIISVDGTILPEPLSLDAIQQQYDQSNVARSVKNDQTAQEPEQTTQEHEQIQQESQPIEDKFDYAKITNENDGKVKRVDVTDEEGKNRFPNAKDVFLIQDKGAMPKFVVMDEEGNLTSYVGKRGDKIHLKGEMTIDEYKKQRQEGLQMIAAENADSSMMEENSGAIEVEDNEEGKLLNRNDDGAQTEQNQPSASVTTSQEDAAGSSESKDTNISANGNENNEILTFEDGTPIPVDVNGEVDLSQTDATHAAEWYDNNLGEDADDWLDGEIKKAKKVLEQAKNKKLAGTKPSELVASKKEKEAAIADAQAHYDSAISIRDSLKERRIAKVEDTAEGRKELIEKARRKFARLKSAVKNDAEAVSQLYRETIGSLLHRLYDGTGIDVTDTIPLTAEEYVASNLGAHSLNYEGTETSKGVKQETGLSREDFAKTQLLAADGKGTTIDALVHSLWDNLPSNLESLDTQDIRNALIGVLNSGFKASEARNFVENIRIAQAENILEEQKRAQENAAYAEQHKAEPEAELKAKSDEKAELKAKSEEKLDNESSNESNDLGNDLDNEKTNDKINDNINAPEVPEDATDENPLGAQRDSAPFSPKHNTKVTNSSEERKAMVKKNAVRSEDVLDHSIGKKMRKSLSRIAKMMGADIIYLHSADSNGWYDEKTNTIYLALDSADVLGTQFVFGHEMTHEIKAKNPAAFEELKNLVKNMMGEDAFNTITDKTQQKYEKGGATYWKDRNAMEEEVVADQIGNWIHDANYAHTLMMKMSHPLLAKLHEIVNRIRFAFTGTEYSDNAKLILRSIEQAYMKTANGQVTNSETGEDVSFSLRQKPEPKKKGIGYKIFVLKDGKLYPPMVANPDGAATPVGVWLDADAAPIAGESKTGRPQVKQGGKGTQGGSGKLAYRPGWHLGVVPYAIQFNRKDADGNKTLFPKNFVFAEVEYAADVDYQEEARQEGINPSGKYQHSLAGLKHLPTDGYYMYRTNPNPETDPWVITGAMKVNRILTRAEQADLVSKAGREPQQIQEGDIVTDDVVNSINQEIADAPKFSLKDNQENPLNQDGTLKLDKIKSVDELTDEDFTSAFRNVELPAIPKNVDAAIGANGKPIVIKKNIFEKNWNAHKFTPAESKKVLNDALYNTDLVGHTQPTKKPNHWVAIKLDEKSPITVLEVNDNKDNVEVVGWYTLDERNLGRIKRQAERNGGELIMLTPKDDKVESLSTPPLSSAAKIDNSSETAKGNGEKFSLKDEKTMFGMHNISVNKLRKAIKQGGFAAPSMGVVDSKNGIYSDYGEITLIPKAEKLAKRTGKNAGTFMADAWTPTYPQVERIMNKQGEKAFNTDMNVKLGDVDNGIYSNVRESWKGYLSSGDVRDGLYWHYLFDNGMNPETIYQTGKYDNDITNEVMRISDNGNKTDYTDKEVAELIQLMNKATGKDNDVDAQREKLKARIASAEKQGNHLLVALKKKRLEELEGVENFYVAADFVNDVVRNNRKNGKVDVHDTMGTAKKKVEDNKKLSDDFPSWLDKKTEEYGVEEMLYNGTTPSGKPKYIPNTIENAVKLMKKQGVAGGYTAFGSELGVFIAKNSPEVNTLAAMKNAKDKLIPFGDERHNQIKDKITKEFLELSDEIRVGSNNRYAFDDSGVSRMVELTDHKGNEKEYLKKAYNIEVSDEWMDRYNKLLDTIKKDYKVFYFETKFMRPYGLDEFEKAIVPSDTPSDVIDALKKAGIDVSSYERGNAEDRQKVTMDAINSSDNIRFSLRGSTPYGKQMEEWMEKNHLEKGAVPMEKPIMKEGENIFDYANRMVEWTRNQNLWKTAPKQTGFQDALDKWKADNGLSPDAYPPVRPHRENYSTEIGYAEDLEEYNKKKELWKSAPKPKDFDLSVDLEDMNKQLRNIRRAVLNQKNYDQRTVKAVSDLVRKMLNIGWGDGLSRGKVGNLLSAAKNATGANDVKKYLDNAMGILAENYLNRLSTAYDNLINTKGARADQSGVIKMGSLDANGQAFMSEYKKAINMDDSSLNTYIANIEEDSAKNEDNVEMNDYRLAGIQAAIMYKQQIGGNDADIAELKRQIGELKNKKDATKEDKDLLKSLEKKLFENKFDRITMYENLLNNIQRMVKESKGRAKEFREEITEHKNEILHRANLDLEGVDSTYYDTTTAKKKLVNNDLQRAVFSSTYTFEQFLKFFGKKAANGEGYLYNYFTKLNQDALDEEQLYNEMNRNALDEKTKELFGKEKFMKLVGIDGKGMKEMDIEVTDYSNKETGKRTIHLKQGQMLYIYLVNKETDGEMKLRAMGITEEDVAAIEENLDPRVKAMGEWLQDEYLPECQRRYQATHTKYFGAPMKEVENYFPLAINNRARNVKEDVNQDSDAMSQLAGTSTGAIVTRRVNVIPLDIENADAFEVAFNHLQEMEEWSAMLPFRQDINTLLSYTHFRNQVQNMSSVAYGSGKTLWDEFKQTAQIAAGTYKPKVNAGMMDSRIAAAMGGIAVAKISGRLWTAIKQSQSATVFLPECDFTRFVKNGVNPYGSWKWAMENIPDFRKRVENMTYGDVKLRQYLDELEKWHDWTKTISKIGMAPNILVDGITCAVGARSVYETEVNRMTKLGYPKEKAEEKAYYKAVAAYNKTQQSSGGMYLSPMQVDRTYVSAALSLFKNANYAYGRMQIEACRGLARTYDFWGGKHKTTLIESMTRQIMEEDGLDENTARAIAKATYNRTFRQSIGRLINFATLVPVSWALYKVLPYLLTGDDDDKKKDMIEEAVLKGFATSLSDNYVIPFASNILNTGLKVEDGKPTFDPEVFKWQNLYINPATSDLANIYSMIGNQKWYSVANKLGMLGVQSLIGFNPETVGALYQAVSEADYDNGNTAKEWQIGILKAISAPEESIRELYMDELGLKSGDKDAMKKLMSLAGLDADDINKVPLAELEKRYAERQINRDNLLSQIGMDAETFNGYVDKYQKSFEKKIKDKMDKWDEYDKKKADEFFDTTSDPKLKDMIEKKRAKDANAAADEQIAKEGLNQEKKGKEPSEEAYDAVKMSIDVAEDNAISTYNKVLNKRYAALNDEYNNQTDAMKYIFMSKHPNFKSYKDLESEYTTYGKKMKELKEKLVSADGYDAKQTILKQIRAEREKFSELQSRVR